jgi:hypothetical protein
MSDEMRPRVTHCPQCGREFGTPGMRCDLINGCMDNIKPRVQLQRPWEVAGTTEPILSDDHPLMRDMSMLMVPKPKVQLPSFIDITGPVTPVKGNRFEHNQFCRDDWEFYHGAGPRGMGPDNDGCVCSLDPKLRKTAPDRGKMPRLWDVEPLGVVHIAGTVIVLFGRYMRQRCDWCGIILLEYDLARVAGLVGTDPTPAHWPPGSLVRVDGNVSASIDNPEVKDGEIQIPPDCCAFDPKTQIA